MNTIKKLLLIENFGDLFTAKKIEELLIHYKEIILYIIFGIVTTIVNWVVYSLLVNIWNVDLSAFSADGMISLLLSSPAAAKEIFAENRDSVVALFASNIIAWVAGVIVAFITNKIWVFESKSKKPSVVIKELGLFVTSRLFTGIIEWFGLPLVIMLGLNQSLFGIEGFAAKLLISVIVIVLNYIFSKLIIFKKNKKSAR